ncbi:hypothetical protein HDU76_001666 [Blyttiomyces sp. JEL0837]|nr:hypothetical protein HDU76_001666 [Blyttiomyces sp. JEL0837]
MCDNYLRVKSDRDGNHSDHSDQDQGDDDHSDHLTDDSDEQQHHPDREHYCQYDCPCTSISSPPPSSYCLAKDHVSRFFESIDQLFFHIPLRQMWLDELPDWMLQDKIKLFAVAACRGHIQLVEYLLQELQGHPKLSHVATYILRIAVCYGDIDVVLMLLDIDGIEPTFNNHHASPRDNMIFLASQAGHVEMVRYLISISEDLIRPDDDNPDSFTGGLAQAASLGRADVVKFLLDVEGIDVGFNRSHIFKFSALNGHVDIVQMLLGVKGIDPSHDVNHVLYHVVANGCLDVVKLMVGLEGVELGLDNINSWIAAAARRGQLEMIKYLLETLEGADVGADNHEALMGAAGRGHIHVVEFLFQFERVDVTYDMVEFLLGFVKDVNDEVSGVLGDAALSGDIDIVRLLLGVEGIDPTVYENFALAVAVREGHLDIVRLLLSVEGVDPSADDNYALIVAATEGHTETVRLLLSVDGVDPCAKDNNAIRNAAAEGHADVVELLLSVEGIDPCAKDNDAIKNAAAKGHIDVVRLLLSVEGVDVTAENNYAMWEAEKQGFAEIVELISAHLEGVRWIEVAFVDL